MRFAKQGVLLLFVGSMSLACAADTEGERANDSDNTGAGGDGTMQPGVGGGDQVGSGGSDVGTGGMTTGSGGTDTGSGGSVSTATPCTEGTVTASNPPEVLVWEVQNGQMATEVDGTATSVTLTGAGSGSNDPYIAGVLSTWAMSGRQCVDASSFTGVQFDVSGSAGYLAFKVAISGTDPSGHCASNCYGHPEKQISFGTGIQVAFSELTTPAWGNGASFDPTQILSLVWATDDKDADVSVSNVSFY